MKLYKMFRMYDVESGVLKREVALSPFHILLIKETYPETHGYLIVYRLFFWFD